MQTADQQTAKVIVDIARIVLPAHARAEAMNPGDIMCRACGHIASPANYRYGDGKRLGGNGRHEAHRYCPSCGADIDWRERGYYQKAG